MYKCAAMSTGVLLFALAFTILFQQRCYINYCNNYNIKKSKSLPSHRVRSTDLCAYKPQPGVQYHEYDSAVYCIVHLFDLYSLYHSYSFVIAL